MKNTAICVILYNPTVFEIKQLQMLVVGKRYIYVYDNSETSSESIVKEYLHNFDFEYIFNGNNNGISVAYNFVAKRALEAGYENLLCLDQDSSFTKKNLALLYQLVDKNMNDSIGIMAVDSEYSGKTLNKISKYLTEINFSITSGSVLNLNIFKNVKGFDENLFVDGVDRDYSLTLINRGYKIIKMNGILFKHNLGEGKKNFFGIYEHSPLRNYYIYRNRMYIMKKHNQEFSLNEKIRSKYLATLRQVLSILLNESNKKEKLEMIIRAHFDFINNKFGKY